MRRPAPGHLYLGSVLLLGVLLSVLLELRLFDFEAVDRTIPLEACTGVLLLVYLAAQWRVAHLRATGRMGAAVRHMPDHRLLGALGPLILYMHAPELGHGYLAVLAVLFLANVAVALLDRETLGLKAKRLYVVWLILHVSLSVLVTVLAGLHAFTSIYYE